MSSTAMELRPAMTAGRVGQVTAVEQSRAVAEVQAAVIVAQQCPRSVPMAIAAMEEACAQIELAEQAFFRFPRAGETVEGPSVHLARELARCWGNVQYGVRELARDDMHGQSEMQAWAWDVQTNTRSSSDFIVPHKRDTKKGVKDLTDMRDIYENNANNGARRAREAIFTVLPAWYRARAEKLCRETIENGGGVPLAQRITDAVKAFERLRVSPSRMAAKFGYKSVDEMNAADVAQLGVIYSSIRQGTVTVDEEFPAETDRIAPDNLATAADAKPAAAKPKAAATDASPAQPAPPPASAAPTPQQGAGEALPPLPGEEDEPGPAPSGQPAGNEPAAGPGAPDMTDYDTPGTVTTPQITAIWTVLSKVYEFGNDEKDQARMVCAYIVGHDLSSTTMLNKNEAKGILDTLNRWHYLAEKAGEHPRTYMIALMAAQDGADGE